MKKKILLKICLIILTSTATLSSKALMSLYNLKTSTRSLSLMERSVASKYRLITSRVSRIAMATSGLNLNLAITWLFKLLKLDKFLISVKLMKLNA